MAANCRKTGDLFSFDFSQEVVQAHKPERVRSATLAGKIARAVSETLKECGKTREEIAAEMSDYLGEPVTKAVLDACASEAKEDHVISFIRLCALVKVTGDGRPLAVAAELGDLALIQERYVWAVKEAMCADQIEALDAQRTLARRRWKGRR